MGEHSGIDLLRLWKKRRPTTPFVLITAHAEVNSAVEAMKLGAEDYLTKPVNPDELLMLITRCIEFHRKDETIRQLQERLDERLGFEKMIGSSQAILKVFEQARMASQPNVLHVLVTPDGTPVGSNDDKQVDVRAIAATSRRLEEMVKDGRFRKDLYYRLNVVTIQLPALRERREDIPLLTAHFLKAFGAAHGKLELSIDAGLMDF